MKLTKLVNTTVLKCADTGEAAKTHPITQLKLQFRLCCHVIDNNEVATKNLRRFLVGLVREERGSASVRILC